MNEIIIKEPMTEWKEYKLGEIIQLIGGGTPKTSVPEYWDGNIPWLSVSDFNNGKKYVFTAEKHITQLGLNNSSTKLLHKDDIIISARGTVGVVAMIGSDMAFNQSCYGIRNKDLVDKQYLYYLLVNSVNGLKQNAYGGVFDTITRETFDLIDVSLPSLDEQRRIAAILSSLDDKIDLLHRENATLEQMAETMFRQWFVVEAKEEWEEGKLGDYVVETVGGEWGKENPEGEYTKAVQCIRGTDIADLNVGLATKTPIRFVKESKFEKIEPRNGDIIMEISGGTENQSTGRVTYVNKDVKVLFDYPIVFSNFCRLLRVKEEYTYFVYCYMKYLYEQDEFFNLENGSSGIKNLDYKALLYELTYPMPTHKQQILDFNDKVSVYFEKINRNKLQIQTLIQTRDELLPRLMSGEINLLKG